MAFMAHSVEVETVQSGVTPIASEPSCHPQNIKYDIYVLPSLLPHTARNLAALTAIC